MIVRPPTPAPNPYTVTPSRPANANPISVEPSRNGQTAAALLLAQEGPGAMEMDLTNEEEMVLSGGKALLRHRLLTAIRRGMIDSLQSFKAHVRVIETGKRVSKVAKLTASKDKAERIAETLAKERSTTPQILGGLIDEKVANANQSKSKPKEDEMETLRRKVQSLEAKANSRGDNKPAKNARGGSARSSGRGRGGGRGTGRAPARKSTPSTPNANAGRGTGGRRNATANDSQKKKGGRSNGRSAGRGRGSSTKKRN